MAQAAREELMGVKILKERAERDVQQQAEEAERSKVGLKMA